MWQYKNGVGSGRAICMVMARNFNEESWSIINVASKYKRNFNEESCSVIKLAFK